MAPTPDGQGYWLVAADGGVFAFGDAPYQGSEGGTHLAAPVIGMAATTDGQGYWLAGADGGVFTHGTAAFAGSAGGLHLTQPVVAITPDPHFTLSIITIGGTTINASDLHGLRPALAWARTHRNGRR
jgi:hypothetical protein